MYYHMTYVSPHNLSNLWSATEGHAMFEPQGLQRATRVTEG